MKTIKTLFMCMVATIFVNAQQNVPPFISEGAEVTPPKFTAVKTTDKQNALHQFITDYFVYPDVVGTVHEGTEVVQFVVNTSGKLSDFNIINSVSREIDDEVIRVLKMTNNMWLAGSHNGTPVAMEREIALAIKTGETINYAESKDFDKIAQDYYKKASVKLLVKKKTRQALRNYKAAALYKPYDKSTLTMLAICKLELGQKESAYEDISRIQKLGGLSTSEYPVLSKNIQPFLKSHEALTALLASDKNK